MSPPPSQPESTQVGAKYWQLHRNIYFAAVAALVIANVITGAPWWSFWPIFGWGIAALFHFFIVRSLTSTKIG